MCDEKRIPNTGDSGVCMIKKEFPISGWECVYKKHICLWEPNCHQ